MRCPRCTSDNSSVVDSRAKYGGKVVYRRRRCNERGCRNRWSTIEAPAELFDELVEVVGTYIGIAETVNATSSDGRRLVDQLFGLQRD